MRVWSLISQKGGCGKSTLATQLATLAWHNGEKVVIIDLDRQSSAAHWSGLRHKSPPEVVRALPERLAKVIEAARDMGHSLVIVDTPPHTDSSALEAIKAADLIITPSKAAEFELAALKETAEVIDLAGRKHLAIGVVNDVTPTKSAYVEFSVATARIHGLGLRFAKSYLSHRKAFTDAIAAGMGVTEGKHASGKAAQEIVALYNELKSADTATNVVSLKEKA